MTGARNFDPFNVGTLRGVPNIECLVLVHQDDVGRVQLLPNLLRLKRDLRVHFVNFNEIADAKSRRFVNVFPRAGVVIIDAPAILGCKSGKTACID